MTLISDVLGLHVSSKFILVGHGNQAVLHTPKESVQLPLGARQSKVHGFALSSCHDAQHLLLLYGENAFSLFIYSVNEKSEPFQLIYEGETRDWINAAVIFDNDEKKDWKLVVHMSHSAFLYLQCSISSMVCSVLELASCTDCSMLYHTRLYGNNYNDLAIISGNAFGELLIWHTQCPVDSDTINCTKIYPLLLRIQAHNGVIYSINFNLALKILVTTSDDRSVKFWKIQKVGSWKTFYIKPMFSCFGHTSRVMSSIIVENGGHVCVISAGEDSYVCIWNCSGDLLLKRRQQFGAPIWRLGFDKATSTLYSTSSIGNVVAYNIKNIFNRQKNRLTMVDDIDATSEFIGKLKFVNDKTIVGLSSKNRIFYMNLETISPHVEKWYLVSNFPYYKRTVLAAFDGVIATCGYKRITLHSYNVKKKNFEIIFDGVRLKGTIRAFHFLTKEHYLVSDELGNCQLLKGRKLDLDSHILLNNFGRSWTTAALLVVEKYLFLSNRKGHVMVYYRCAGKNFELKNTVKCLHGNMGSTFLKLLNINSHELHVMSGGHEPYLKYLRLRFADNSLTVLQRERVPLGWVEASPGEDLLLGFNDNHIVAWSRKHDVLVQIACGGGHRYWDYHLHNDILCIFFIKHKKVFFYRSSLCNEVNEINVQRINWHARNCNTIKLLTGHNALTPLLLSAGDDNIIKIAKLVNDNLIHCAELHSHISSVRCLETCLYKFENGLFTWLIFSVGGRSQLCINQIDEKVASACNVSELCTHKVLSTSESKICALEARLMAISIAQHTLSGIFTLYIASAEGEIRVYRWLFERPLELHLINFLDIKRCPLKMHWINSKSILLITTTNGEIYGFDQKLSKQRFQLQLHDGGINTLDIKIYGQLLHVLSGGDDENIQYTILNLDNFTVQQNTAFLGLHNAQVNAVSLQQDNESEGSQLFGYSCSVDKQIYRINLMTHQFIRVGCTCIADIKGMLLDEHQRMYFYGCGIQILRRTLFDNGYLK
ncbi:WD repeat-containing protein 6 isoform X1 [Drosophila pseudoobscura]|uniref:tRNA (34-2'-O)-methyltransferase regulator WDR6 n=2 Tax=Drosophila pseudoobscura pseudoobscura TaxID=46245 RepID=A0A6I8V873_DROPS|nr:WD repeat-containing protein 6 isoform X1 [Drosophila pseudoobscura]